MNREMNVVDDEVEMGLTFELRLMFELDALLCYFVRMSRV